MKKSLQKKLLLLLMIWPLFPEIFAQWPVTEQEKKIDTVAQKFIRYLNNKNFDSLYNLTGKDFQKELPYQALKDILQTYVCPDIPYYNIVYEQTEKGVSKYRAESCNGMFQVSIGLDSLDKIKTIYINPLIDCNP